MRTFPLQTGDYAIASMTSRNNNTFKVSSTRKELVFRGTLIRKDCALTRRGCRLTASSVALLVCL